MRRVRQSGTKPERIVCSALSASGARYRLNVRSLPGSPDLANKTRRKVIFVHGCFWHGHGACGRGRIPTANRALWTEKLRDNRMRDRRKERVLRAIGYDVLVVWGCELDDRRVLAQRLRRFWFGSSTRLK